MESPNGHLVFQVNRRIPELVVPAESTPHELKKLSDVDDQKGLRFQVPVIWFYRNNNYSNNPSMERKDPVKVIREALGKALVYYYPFAGRLIEDCNKNLTVDCNGQGVLFIEANADVTFDQLGHTIQPPSPFLNEVLLNVPGSDDIFGCPLLLIQVTRLLCGGFILALRLNHTMSDAFGLNQFMNTLEEMAKGAEHPTVPPVWKRELLNARNPPRVTRIHREFDQEILNDQYQPANLHDGLVDQTNMVQFSIFFNPNQIREIRNHLPTHLRSTCSRFELLTACLWKCRTYALDLDPEEVVKVSGVVNGRGKKIGLNLPMGYYGNAFAYPAAVSKAGVLCKKPLAYAVELVKKAKSEMSEEYIRSVADLMVIRGRPGLAKRNLIVSDVTSIGFEKLDFGWGLPEYAGPAMGFPVLSFFVKYKTGGEDGIVMPICLPLLAVERFRQEVKKMTEAPSMYETTQAHVKIKSTL